MPVGATILVLDRDAGKLLVGHAVKRGNVHCVKEAIEGLYLQVPLAERAYAAVPAEVVVHVASRPFRRLRLVVAQRCLALQQPEVALHGEAFQKRDFRQKLQLQRLVPSARSRVHSNRMAPQWQLPL